MSGNETGGTPLFELRAVTLRIRARTLIQGSIEEIIATGSTKTLIYVTHHADKIPQGITHTLRL